MNKTTSTSDQKIDHTHPSPEVPFQTSGTTGPPRIWWRRHDQLEAEARMVADLFTNTYSRIVNFAPPKHLFGALFGDWLPRLTGKPVLQAWRQPLAFPQVNPRESVLFVCLPLTWQMFHRHHDVISRLDEVVMLHSSATLPPTGTRGSLKSDIEEPSH